MEQNTKLIIAAVGLGGLGFFLYKKGLFGKKTVAEVAKEVKKDVVDVVTPPPTPIKTVTKPCQVTYHNCTRNPRKEIIQIPYDDEKCYIPMKYGGYQPDLPPCAEQKIDYDSEVNSKFNQLLYA